jgi:hypothetical protein
MPTIDQSQAAVASPDTDALAASQSTEPPVDTELVTDTGSAITDESGNPILIES